MATKEEAEKANRMLRLIVDKYRRILFAVKLSPFIVCAFYVIGLTLYLFDLSYTFYNFMDSMIFASPLLACIFLWISKILGLCKYHKLAILIPISGQIPVILSHFIMIDRVITLLIILIISIILTIISGIKVLKNDGKRNID